MDKAVIKTFAVESRRKLMEDVEYRMSLLGITKDNIAEPITKADGVEAYDYGASTPHQIYDEDIKKRENLVKEVQNKGFENVVEEVAYTWFNRIIAIRFMEVNDYLPTKTRVLSSETPGKTEPDIITESFDLDLDYTQEDRELIFKLKDENKLDDLFRFLFIKQCNKLNEILPGLFEKTEDYMELLLTISFTSEEGVVRRLVDTISEEDFGEQVEIIGWLYQFYNTELKDDTFAKLKKKVKITKERIPAATQLFTPDWIVKYMVENSLGRLWLEGHPNEELKFKWKYYVDEAEQELKVELQLVEIRKDSKELRPEDIKIIDPCMGSGHILVYVFDILMQIYVSEGYTEKDAAISILENNLYGLDIDDRAYQLAYFAVIMKARSYNRRILNTNIYPMLLSIKESNFISINLIDFISSYSPEIKMDLLYIVNQFKDAKEYGSILDIKQCNFNQILDVIENIKNKNSSDLDYITYENDLNLLKFIILQAEFLSKKYDIVITNPPYMGNSGMNNNLKDYLKKNYPNSKSDLFAVFIEKCQDFAKNNGLIAMITQQSFMFLSTYEKLRESLISSSTMVNMVHLGAHAFEEIGGEVVQATSFVNRNLLIDNYNSTFHRLIDFNSEKGKEEEFFNSNNIFISHSNDFNKIPGSPIAYWADKHVFEAFKKGEFLNDISDVKQGLATADNNRFLRHWYEVDYNNIGLGYGSCDESKNSNLKWFPYNKGGKYKKWYGNQDYVINWQNDGLEIKNFNKSVIRNSNFYFLPAISWSNVTSSNVGFRYYPKGFIFDTTGCSLFINDLNFYYLFAFLNSNVCQYILYMIAPTLHYNVGDIGSLPYITIDENSNKIKIYVRENIEICKNDWDDYETSWNFKTHPFIRFKESTIEKSFNKWLEHKESDFNKLKSNEIELNKIFADIYSINVDSNVEDKHVSVTKADYENDIKSFISFAVGCMFGRYDLNQEGLSYAGGNFDLNSFNLDIVDNDNIIPILDTEYFEDDIVGKFVSFVKEVWGSENLEENLNFISGALNTRGNTSREMIRNYFLNNFYADHVKMYKKCPIYWQFDSGKQNGFKCLIYIHRYESDLLARIRTEYLHKTQKAIEQNISNSDNIINNSSIASEKNKFSKLKNKLLKQLEETREYDEALANIAHKNINLDLDDGIKVNYDKFQNVDIPKEGQKNKKFKLLKKI